MSDIASGGAAVELTRLLVDRGGRLLVTSKGGSFFYLGDTAWELLHRLRLDEACEYLEARAAQGFNVVECVALAELDGLRQPTPDGHVPFLEEDPLRPYEPYWRHVDEVVRFANRCGIYIGLLPTWGDKWNIGSGKGPEIFNPSNAEDYGRWLGARYRNDGIIWILGGDRRVEKPEHRRILDAMAAGLRQGDGGRSLITFHPVGGRTSKEELPECAWLDFDMFQSGHSILSLENWYFAHKCRAAEPVRPYLDGEPCYEDHEVMLPEWKPVKPGWRFDAQAVRRAAWWSLLSGSCGHVYGAQPCWMMWDERYEPFCGVRMTWRAALSLPGAAQMRLVAEVAREAGSLLSPEAWRVVGTLQNWDARPVAASTENGLIIYSPQRQDISLNLEGLPPRSWRLFWEDPAATGLCDAGLSGAGLPKSLFIPSKVASPGGCDVLYFLLYEN